MFGQQKNTAANQNSGNQNPNGQNFLDIDSMPIYTMKDDLAGTQPGLVKPSIAPLPTARTAAPTNNLPENKVASPFLSEKSSWDNKPTIETIKVATPSVPTPSPFSPPRIETIKPRTMPISPTLPAEKPSNSGSGTNWTMVAFSTVAACLIISILWFGYTIWNNNQQKQAPVADDQPAMEQPVTPAPALSDTNPNYLRISAITPQSDEVKQLLRTTAEKVRGGRFVQPVEFILTNQQNSPIAFPNFAVGAGLNISPDLMNNLTGDFKLYFYNDPNGASTSGLSKAGLVLELNNALTAKMAMTQAEPNLPDQLSPLFFTSDYRKDKNFGSSTYKNAEIRFINVVSPEELSVDYTIIGNKLIIGTTKATIRAIIDKIAPVTAPLTQQTPQ